MIIINMIMVMILIMIIMIKINDINEIIIMIKWCNDSK